LILNRRRQRRLRSYQRRFTHQVRHWPSDATAKACQSRGLWSA
jgi:hypothetical protein